MSTNDLTEAKYLLSKVLTTEGADLVLNHPWIWEVDRWKELVFALLTRVVDLPEHRLRGLVNDLEYLELLDITALTELYGSHTTPDLGSSHAQRVLQLFKEKGWSEADAQRGMTTICEAAIGLEKYYSGKVQRYMRHYGELMLRDLGNIFQFSALGEVEVKKAFTYWLQNVLNMPVSLADECVEAFCRENHLTVEEVFAAADELNMNVALVDDLIQRHVEMERNSAAQAVEDTNVESASEGGRHVTQSGKSA